MKLVSIDRRGRQAETHLERWHWHQELWKCRSNY